MSSLYAISFYNVYKSLFPQDLRDVGDWRKNIEEKAGMEGRKKMFEGAE